MSTWRPLIKKRRRNKVGRGSEMPRVSKVSRVCARNTTRAATPRRPVNARISFMGDCRSCNERVSFGTSGGFRELFLPELIRAVRLFMVRHEPLFRHSSCDHPSHGRAGPITGLVRYHAFWCLAKRHKMPTTGRHAHERLLLSSHRAQFIVCSEGELWTVNAGRIPNCEVSGDRREI